MARHTCKTNPEVAGYLRMMLKMVVAPVIMAQMASYQIVKPTFHSCDCRSFQTVENSGTPNSVTRNYCTWTFPEIPWLSPFLFAYNVEQIVTKGFYVKFHKLKYNTFSKQFSVTCSTHSILWSHVLSPFIPSQSSIISQESIHPISIQTLLIVFCSCLNWYCKNNSFVLKLPPTYIQMNSWNFSKTKIQFFIYLCSSLQTLQSLYLIFLYFCILIHP